MPDSPDKIDAARQKMRLAAAERELRDLRAQQAREQAQDPNDRVNTGLGASYSRSAVEAQRARLKSRLAEREAPNPTPSQPAAPTPTLSADKIADVVTSAVDSSISNLLDNVLEAQR